MSANPIGPAEQLDTFAAELDKLSSQLTETERRLEPLELAVEEWEADYEADQIEKAREAGERPPGEERCKRFAHRDMPKEIRGEYFTLTAKRRRLEKRIVHLKVLVDAQRSLLSAAKVEAEATGSGLRSAA